MILLTFYHPAPSEGPAQRCCRAASQLTGSPPTRRDSGRTEFKAEWDRYVLTVNRTHTDTGAALSARDTVPTERWDQQRGTQRKGEGRKEGRSDRGRLSAHWLTLWRSDGTQGWSSLTHTQTLSKGLLILPLPLNTSLPSSWRQLNDHDPAQCWIVWMVFNSHDPKQKPLDVN